MKSDRTVSSLKRITTEYIEVEDRVRLAGLTDNNQTVSIWLTMRLLRRLISPCLSLLKKNTSELKKVVTQNNLPAKGMQNFVQQSTDQQLVQETAVKVTENSPNHHATEIDISNDHAGVMLSFKDEFGSDYSIYLNNGQLRQWLGTLQIIWQKAEWPTEIWPDWMVLDISQPTSGDISVH